MLNLEKDLINSGLIREKTQSDCEYAQKLYAALCNIQWYKDDPEDNWTCSWRYAGEVVSNLVAEGEDYLDYYCSGSEGHVDKEIEEDLASLGWKWRYWPEE